MNPIPIERALAHPFDGIDLPFLGRKRQGKVRDIYELDDDRLLLVATDRLSAFDRILGLVPYKGQVLNQLAAFWFAQVADIIGSHFIGSPDPNVTIGRKCRPLPVEVVVRGYITGVTSTALWVRYSQGERTIYGMDFPDGLHKNDPLPEPIITPTTKAQDGGHDERITSAEIVERGLVSADLWEQVCAAAIAVFQRGQAIARRGGLILVDTKYEFGLTDDGELVLIDEMHTPDSSRFWTVESYEEVTAKSFTAEARRGAEARGGEAEERKGREERAEPENFDKEFIRLYYAARGYRGEGEPFPMPEALAVQAAARYIRAYEMLTGRTFEPGEYPAGPRIKRNLRGWMS
ncbi:MAG: phosphoribosylaminoimidazolesuccinocarboxamide synthase [Chloroflexi bacterium]|nr:phosphoribosylaminoimidazolesuccinocarboxamide synthase [Chloroflexota bacterium]